MPILLSAGKAGYQNPASKVILVKTNSRAGVMGNEGSQQADPNRDRKGSV